MYKMFSNHTQNFHEEYFIFLPQPIPMYPSQPNLLYQQNLNQNYYQYSYKNNWFSFNRSLQYYCRKYLPLAPPQNKFHNKISLNNNFSKKRDQKTYVDTKVKKQNHFRCIDLSNIKIFPPQEEISFKDLEVPRKKKKRWTKEEDLLLCELKSNTKLTWRHIASKFPTRTLKACQFRASVLKISKKDKNNIKEDVSTSAK